MHKMCVSMSVQRTWSWENVFDCPFLFSQLNLAWMHEISQATRAHNISIVTNTRQLIYYFVTQNVWRIFWFGICHLFCLVFNRSLSPDLQYPFLQREHIESKCKPMNETHFNVKTKKKNNDFNEIHQKQIYWCGWWWVSLRCMCECEGGCMCPKAHTHSIVMIMWNALMEFRKQPGRTCNVWLRNRWMSWNTIHLFTVIQLIC